MPCDGDGVAPTPLLRGCSVPDYPEREKSRPAGGLARQEPDLAVSRTRLDVPSNGCRRNQGEGCTVHQQPERGI